MKNKIALFSLLSMTLSGCSGGLKDQNNGPNEPLPTVDLGSQVQLIKRAKAEFDVTSSGDGTASFQLVKKSYAAGTCSHGFCTDFTDVTVTNATKTQFALNQTGTPGNAFSQGSTNNDLSNFLTLNLASLYDNDLFACSSNKCTTALVQIYTTGTAPGLYNSVNQQSIPLFVTSPLVTTKTAIPLGTSNPGMTPVPVSSLLILQQEAIPVAQQVVSLSDGAFATPSYQLFANMTTAGAGIYRAHVVVEYDLAASGGTWSLAQDLVNIWTWEGGVSSGLANAKPGTKGTPSTANYPSNRGNGTSWTDGNGDFWMFGGNGKDTNSQVQLSDLWKFSPSTSQWTWVSGAIGYGGNGTYGTKGTPSTSNMPGARSYPSSWVDASGNFWIFSGYGDAGAGSGPLNDLWKYVPGTGTWTWVAGANLSNQGGTYGTIGTAAAANTPGGRAGSATWKDSSGNLWVFGGKGFDSGSAYGHLNDLWKYNPSTNQWTWVSGSNLKEQPGTYGTKGTPSSSNNPGGRSYAAFWADASGNFWIFGGEGDATTATPGDLNDLWKYNPSTNQWTWVSGSNLRNQSGTYGTKGTAAAANVPAGRSQNPAYWVDASGNFWIFGGIVNGSYYNDVWTYSPTSDQWTWVSGSSSAASAGVYGTVGVPNQSSFPGGRNETFFWSDANNLWIMGGYGYDSVTTNYLNDLWKFKFQ